MNADDSVDDEQVSDTALMRRFREGGEAERAEIFLAIYGRFRCTAREEMERAGLSAQEAEARVGAVFDRTMDALRKGSALDGNSLREHVTRAARSMAADAEWRRAP